MVVVVRHCLVRFLVVLKEQFGGDSFLINARSLMKVVGRHARVNFEVYVGHCSNQFFQSRDMKKLK